MPPRLNKRQQRELEELSALKALQASHEVEVSEREDGEEEEQEMVVSVKKPAVGFAALSAGMGMDSDKSEQDDDEQDKPAQKKGKKKKKKSTSTVPSSTAPAPAPAAISAAKKQEPSVPTMSKKADKKAKARQKKAEQDSFESALKEMSQKYPELQTIASQSNNASSSSTFQTHALALDSFAQLLAVSLTHLDPEAELRKFFGSKVLNAHKSDSSSGNANVNAAAAGRKRRLKAGAGAGVRSNLTNPPREWANARQPREGLTCRALSEEELGERRRRHGLDEGQDTGMGVGKERWWSVDCNRRYKRLTKRFMQIVASGDPNAFIGLLYSFPWHIPTLLQQSEIARHREEHSVASELLSRALFSFELPLQTCAWSWTSGWNRLDFDDVENRGMFLAVHRNIMDLTRRGLFRTAFEFARLMYSMDPWEDPHGSLFWLDWLALRSGMHQWLLDAIQVWERLGGNSDEKGRKMDSEKVINPALLPGWMYSRALAVKMLEDENTKKGSGSSSDQKESRSSAELLTEAILNFPEVVLLLADKADIQIDGRVRSNKEFRIATDAMGLSQSEAVAHLLAHLYVHRAHGLYKETKVSTWFASVVNSLYSPSSDTSDTKPSSRRPRALFEEVYARDENVTHSVYRHVITVHASVPSPQHRSLLAFLPTHTSLSMANSLQCDPAPPTTRLSSYDSHYFEDVGLGSDTGGARDRAEQRENLRNVMRMIRDPQVRAQLQPLLEARPDLVELLEAMGDRGPGGAGDENMVDLLDDVLLEAAQVEAGFGLQGGAGAGAGGGGMPGAFGIEQADGEDGVGAEEEDDEDEGGENDLPAPFRILRNIMGRFWNAGGGEVPADSDSDEEDNGRGGAAGNEELRRGVD